MGTPVLTKLQKKLSLSGKKARKEIIKNVVVDPHKSYWPIVNNELESLTEILKGNLPRVKAVKINVPWRLLKDVPKAERKNIRDDYIKKHAPIEKIAEEDRLIFGVNEVTRLLELDLCSAVLVADMSPRMVVKHVVEMSVLKKVPVLVIAPLKQILKDFCGLESMAVAVKKGFSESSSLRSIVEAIVEISKNYPPSENHINGSRRDIFVEEKEQSQKPVQIKNEEPKTTNYHLIRPSEHQRAFIPEQSENVSNIFQNESVVTTANYQNAAHGTNDYVFDMANEQARKKQVKKNYKALVVKRLKGNKNRENDKAKISKKKSKKKKVCGS